MNVWLWKSDVTLVLSNLKDIKCQMHSHWLNSIFTPSIPLLVRRKRIGVATKIFEISLWLKSTNKYSVLHPMLYSVLFDMFLRQLLVWERLLSRWRWWTSCPMCTCLPGYLVTCHPYTIRLTEMSDPVTGAPYLHHPELSPLSANLPI